MNHRRHLFVCIQTRTGGGKPACGDRGGRALLMDLQARLAAVPEGMDIGVTGCECLGPCFDGPNVVAYPEGAQWRGAEDRGAEIAAAVTAPGAVHGDPCDE